MSTIREKFDDIVTYMLDVLNIKSVGDHVTNANRLIRELKESPSRKFEVVGICAGCATRISIPVIAILQRHHVICPECNSRHTSHDSIYYHTIN